MPAKTLHVRGFKLRTGTMRRYVLVAVRAEDKHTEHGVYAKFARVEKRGDTYVTLATFRRRALDAGCRGIGVEMLIFDTLTGEEV